MFFPTLLTTALSFAALTTATDLIPPTKDPWYTAPSDFASTAPGTILRTREAPSNLSLLVPNAASTYQILFRSRDTRYQPSWAVTTVFFPGTNTTNTSSEHVDLLSFQIPYNTLDLDASPSYGLSSIYGEPIMSTVRSALDRGWVVSVPDFEGPEAAFSAGPQAGQAVLDSVRAILEFDEFKKCGGKEARYALWGYSGGGLASNFAAELQASYAPELDISGVVVGGTPSNFSQVLEDANEGPTAAFIPYALLGVTVQYPEAREWLEGMLIEEGEFNKSAFLLAPEIPVAEYREMVAGQDIWEYFDGGEEAILEAPELRQILGSNWYQGYHGIPQMPMYFYKAIHDEATTIETTDEHVDRFCAVGANVLYHRNTFGDHATEQVNGVPRALDWIAKAFEGEVVPASGCLVEDVTVEE